MKIRHQFDEDYKGSPGSKQSPESQTVPDMGLTLQQLLLNHSRGLPSNVKQYESQYFEELEIPKIEDLTDLKEARANLNRQEKALKARLEAEREAAEPPIHLEDDLPPEPTVVKE